MKIVKTNKMPCSAKSKKKKKILGSFEKMA